MSQETRRTITINILGRNIPIKVTGDGTWVEQMEADIRSVIGNMGEKYAYQDDKDLLIMAVIQYASKVMLLENEVDSLSKGVKKKIYDIDRLFDDSAL